MVRVLLFESFPVEAEPEQKQLNLQAGTRCVQPPHARLVRTHPHTPLPNPRASGSLDCSRSSTAAVASKWSTPRPYQATYRLRGVRPSK